MSKTSHQHERNTEQEDQTYHESSSSIDECLSRELGFDVTTIEAQARFRLDLIRLRRGEPAGLGYVLLERQNHPDVAVVYPTHTLAVDAMENSELIDALCAEGCLNAGVPDVVTLDDLTNRGIILP